jgi:hypothetical protein
MYCTIQDVKDLCPELEGDFLGSNTDDAAIQRAIDESASILDGMIQPIYSLDVIHALGSAGYPPDLVYACKYSAAAALISVRGAINNESNKALVERYLCAASRFLAKIQGGLMVDALGEPIAVATDTVVWKRSSESATLFPDRPCQSRSWIGGFVQC